MQTFACKNNNFSEQSGFPAEREERLPHRKAKSVKRHRCPVPASFASGFPLPHGHLPRCPVFGTSVAEKIPASFPPHVQEQNRYHSGRVHAWSIVLITLAGLPAQSYRAFSSSIRSGRHLSGITRKSNRGRNQSLANILSRLCGQTHICG